MTPYLLLEAHVQNTPIKNFFSAPPSSTVAPISFIEIQHVLNPIKDFCYMFSSLQKDRVPCGIVVFIILVATNMPKRIKITTIHGKFSDC